MDFKKNDIVTVTIEDMGSEGEGIGKSDGFTLFVKDAVVGDTVEARIVKPKKNYAYARLEKLLTPSPYRAEPKCKYYRQCGGCQLQALSYEKQLQFKQEKIRNNLIRIGGFEPEYVDARMEPIVGMDEPWHYRNKAQYPVGTDKDGNIVTGFYAGRTHSIIANTDCALGAAENKEILERILEYMRENKVSAYDEETGKGLVRHVLIRKGFTSGEIMVCLVINREPPASTVRQQSKSSVQSAELGDLNPTRADFLPKQERLLKKLTVIPGMTCISVSINREKTNVIMGKEVYTLWGRDTISDTIHVRDMTKPGYPFTGKELTFHISPLSFYQVNPVQTEKLYSLALEYAGLTGQETVWDLYCGIGTISLFLADSAKKVCGVEIIPQAIEDARENAERNGITNAEFFVGKAEEVLPKFYEEMNSNMRHPDVIVVDPPRKGCDEACLDTMLKMQPKRIVYVSCDSATLARDLRILCDGGYEVTRIRGVDQFGMTVHVETVVLLGRKNTETVSFDIDVPALGIRTYRKATYKEISEYVLEKYGLKVSNLYIAQIKRKCGLELGENYNLPKTEDSRQPMCPPEKEEAILDALKHFGLI
ncbi:MAG: 23S rRNA (uracil(1939)-C(5))-methyltransferase RlmD [Lachnospiraceae bacterium]|nr:23S rRNA (uracil(1939)-C(5))-methyltransferase RlmD [Lachnospiraceae bacterium]